MELPHHKSGREANSDSNQPTFSDALFAFLLVLILVSSPGVLAFRLPLEGVAEAGVERPVAPEGFAGVVSVSSSFVRASLSVGANTGENPNSSLSKSTWNRMYQMRFNSRSTVRVSCKL